MDVVERRSDQQLTNGEQHTMDSHKTAIRNIKHVKNTSDLKSTTNPDA